MNTTLTLQIDDQLRQKVRHVAADEKKTVSAWVAELIERTLDGTDEYEQNRRQALQRLETGFHLARQRLSRDDLHDRG